MPVSISKLGGGYRVSTPNGVKAKHTTKPKAEAQKRLLNAVDHGWKPTHEGLSRPCTAHDITWGGKGYHCLNCGATADHSWNIKHAEQPPVWRYVGGGHELVGPHETIAAGIVDTLLNEG